MLVEHHGELVNCEEIRKKLWPNDTIVEFDYSINAAIRKAARSAGQLGRRTPYIETKRGALGVVSGRVSRSLSNSAVPRQLFALEDVAA